MLLLGLLPAFALAFGTGDCTQTIELEVNEHGNGLVEAGEVDCYSINLSSGQLPSVSGNELIFYADLESTIASVYFQGSFQCNATLYHECRLPAQAGQYTVVVSADEAYSFHSWLKTGAKETVKGTVVENFVAPFTPDDSSITSVEEHTNADGSKTYTYYNNSSQPIGVQTTGQDEGDGFESVLDGLADESGVFSPQVSRDVLLETGWGEINSYNSTPINYNLTWDNLSFNESMRLDLGWYSFAGWSECDEEALEAARQRLNELKSTKTEISLQQEELIYLFIEETRPFDECEAMDKELEWRTAKKINAIKETINLMGDESYQQLKKSFQECMSCDEQFEKMRKKFFYHFNPHERILEPLSDISFGMFAVSIPLMIGGGVSCPETVGLGCTVAATGGAIFFAANIMDAGIDGIRAGFSAERGDTFGTGFYGIMAVWGAIDVSSPVSKRFTREATRIGVKKILIKESIKHLSDDTASFLSEKMMKKQVRRELVEDILNKATKDPKAVNEFLRAVKNKNLELANAFKLFDEKGLKFLSQPSNLVLKKVISRNGREWAPSPDDLPASTFDEAKQKLHDILGKHGLGEADVDKAKTLYADGKPVEWTLKNEQATATIGYDLGLAQNGPNTKHIGIKLTEKTGGKSKTVIHIYDEYGNWELDYGREMIGK